MDDEQLKAWYYADEERARAAYAAADPATLVGLIPLLEARMQGCREQVTRWQEQTDLEPERLAALEESRAEALAALSGRDDAPDHADAIGEISQRLRQLIDQAGASMAESAAQLVSLHTFELFALTGRWTIVRTELERRGLLPGGLS